MKIQQKQRKGSKRCKTQIEEDRYKRKRKTV